MITIDLLKNHPQAIPALSRIWHEFLGKIWMPELTIQEITSLTYEELNHPDETTSFVALCDEIPVGFCTFKLRARAWALWKATFELCQIADKTSPEALLQKRILDEVMNGRRK